MSSTTASNDINSFSLLEISLRSTPFSSTSANTQGEQQQQNQYNNNIDKKFLHLFTKELHEFQERHFGKNAKNTSINEENGLRQWAMMPKIPESVFHDRSRKGPLYIALVSALEYKKQMILVKQSQSSRNINISYSWINDLTQANKIHDHVRMFQKMYKDLHNHGYIPSYRFYFDKSISRAADHDLSKLITIALQFGGSIVDHPQEATHIVALDPEIDSAEERVKEVDYNVDTDEQDDPERLYLRTLSISDDKTKALVHWWFWPNSADEWIDANDVNGVVNEDDNDVDRAENGAWVVSCRFLRDVARFNEWGIEIDYAIMDFEKHIDADVKAVKQHQLKKDLGDSSETEQHLTPSFGSLLRRKRNFSKKAMAPRLIKYQNDRQSKLVLDGALNISPAASDYRLKIQQQHTNFIVSEISTATPPTIVPPSKDYRLGTITVTELSSSAQQPTLNTQQQQVDVPQDADSTIAINRVIKKDSSTIPNATVSATPDATTSSSQGSDNLPSWYDHSKPSSIEKSLLPEWFNSSSPHRTPNTYVTTRNTMIHYIKHNTNKSTFTQVRHSIPGDIGSMYRMYQFLIHYQLVSLNIGEAMPTLSSIRATPTNNTENSNLRVENDDDCGIVPPWSAQQQLLLTQSVVRNCVKRKIAQQSTTPAFEVDWELVAKEVGDVTPLQCQDQFFNMNIAIQPDNNQGIDTVSQSNEAREEESVAKKQKVDSDNRNNILLAANQQSLQEQSDIHTLTLEILNQRLLKLENRLNMLNDVEEFCDLERISLELERRDLFTERCRHWFGH